MQGGRPRNPDDPFEAAVERALGERLRKEHVGVPRLGWYEGRAIGNRLWGSLANVDWTHENGDTASYSLRAAGDLIAAIVGEGDYMTYYCSAEHGVIDEEIADAMAREGWTASVMEAEGT